MSTYFTNRCEAGELLADSLLDYAHRPDTLLLALPRGGVPVAFALASRLHLPLSLCLVRKLGVPQHRELAMGAIAFPDILILNQDLITQLHIASEAIEATITTEKQELSRRAKLYLGARQPPEIAAKTVILVDDGIATGATMKAAIAAIRSQHPSSIIVAVPVASSQSCLEIEPLVEHLLCLESSLELSSISRWYLDFSQTTDREVCQLLDLADKLISSHS